MECANCSCDCNEDDVLWVDSQYVCEECYYNLTNECQLCDERFDDRDTSQFILVKAELGSTDCRPPGIYYILSRPFLSIPMIGSGRLYGSDVLFVDKLPEFDEAYRISGHICKACAARRRYESKLRHVYGKQKLKLWDQNRWLKEKRYTRRVIMANQNMLRDLECDQVHGYDADGHYLNYASANDWYGIKKLYNLPDLPTFHEWLFVEHCGVRIYRTSVASAYYGPGWLSVSPEPRFRYGAGRLFPQTFAASGLPTYQKTSQSCYFEYEDSMTAVKLAIEQGLLRQDGCYSAEGVPVICG